ncbi:MAG: sigma-70 family RNA polymerase sigma factor [Saprospiraceae bacterium]
MVKSPQDIVILLKRKDEHGLSLLYDNYANALLGIIMGIVGNRETAEDILQETFLKIWDSIDTFNDTRGTVFTWIATIARNTAIDKVRLVSFKKQQSTVEISDSAINKMASVDVNDIDSQKLLKMLDKNQKAVLDLIYLQGYTQQDTATALDIPLGTVKTRVRLAIKTLRELLSNEKNLFLGSIILIILTMLNLWT